jgi:hypothetical protein
MLALVTALSLCAPAKAQIDPLTAGQIAFSVAGAIAGFLDSSSRKNWEADAGRKLDQIIGLNYQILAELKQLRIDTARIVQAGFEDFAQRTLRADISQFNFNVDDIANYRKIDGASKIRIQSLLGNLERDAVLSSGYGPNGYQITYAALLGVRALYISMAIPASHQKSFLKQMGMTFVDWLSAKPDYPAGVMASLQAQQSQLARSVQGRRSFQYPYEFAPNNGLCPVTLNVAGDLAAGVSITIVESRCPPAYAAAEIKRITDEIAIKKQEYDQLGNAIGGLKIVLGQIAAYVKEIQTAQRNIR